MNRSRLVLAGAQEEILADLGDEAQQDWNLKEVRRFAQQWGLQAERIKDHPQRRGLRRNGPAALAEGAGVGPTPHDRDIAMPVSRFIPLLIGVAAVVGAVFVTKALGFNAAAPIPITIDVIIWFVGACLGIPLSQAIQALARARRTRSPGTGAFDGGLLLRPRDERGNAHLALEDQTLVSWSHYTRRVLREPGDGPSGAARLVPYRTGEGSGLIIVDGEQRTMTTAVGAFDPAGIREFASRVGLYVDPEITDPAVLRGRAKLPQAQRKQERSWTAVALLAAVFAIVVYGPLAVGFTYAVGALGGFTFFLVAGLLAAPFLAAWWLLRHRRKAATTRREPQRRGAASNSHDGEVSESFKSI